MNSSFFLPPKHHHFAFAIASIFLCTQRERRNECFWPNFSRRRGAGLVRTARSPSWALLRRPSCPVRLPGSYPPWPTSPGRPRPPAGSAIDGPTKRPTSSDSRRQLASRTISQYGIPTQGGCTNHAPARYGSQPARCGPLHLLSRPSAAHLAMLGPNLWPRFDCMCMCTCTCACTTVSPPHYGKTL